MGVDGAKIRLVGMADELYRIACELEGDYITDDICQRLEECRDELIRMCEKDGS